MKDLPPFLANLKDFSGTFVENEIKTILDESYPNRHEEVEFETFLLVSLITLSQKCRYVCYFSCSFLYLVTAFRCNI